MNLFLCCIVPIVILYLEKIEVEMKETFKDNKTLKEYLYAGFCTFHF